MKQLCTNIGKYLLLILFIAYMGCISLFVHSHVVNGVTIVHSHPYNSDVEHTHTSAEFQLIDSLSHIQIADGAVACLTILFALVFLYKLQSDLRDSYYNNLRRSILSLRAPPFLI